MSMARLALAEGPGNGGTPLSLDRFIEHPMNKWMMTRVSPFLGNPRCEIFEPSATLKIGTVMLLIMKMIVLVPMRTAMTILIYITMVAISPTQCWTFSYLSMVRMLLRG